MASHWFENIAKNSLKRGGLKIAGFFLIATILVLFIASRLELVTDSRAFNPIAAWQQLEAKRDMMDYFGGSNLLIVYLTSTARLPIERLESPLEVLANQLQKMQHVHQVRLRSDDEVAKYWQDDLPNQLLAHLNQSTLEKLRQRLRPEFMHARLQQVAHNTDTYMEDSQGIFSERDPLSIFTLVSPTLSELHGFSRFKSEQGFFLNRRRRQLYISLQPSIAETDFNENQQLLTELEGALDKFRITHASLLKEYGISIDVVGRSTILREGHQSVMADAKQGILVSFLLVSFLLWFFFRRLRFALLAMLPIGLSMVVTLAMASLLYEKVNLMALIFLVLLVGLGIDFAFHMGSHYFLLSHNRQKTKQERIGYAISKPFGGMLLGGLTSMVAFGVLTRSQYPVLHQTGVLTAIGIASLFVISLYFLPLLFASYDAPTTFTTPRWANLFGDPLRKLLKWRRCGFVVWGLLLLLSAVGISRLKLETHPWNTLVKGNAEAAELDRVTDEMGVSFSPLLLVSSGSTLAEALHNDRQIMAAAQRWLLKSQLIGVQSLAKIIPSKEQQAGVRQFIGTYSDDFDADGFKRNFQKALDETHLRANDYLATTYKNKVSQLLALTPEEITFASIGGKNMDAYLKQFYRSVSSNTKTPTVSWQVASFLYPRLSPWSEGAVGRFKGVWHERLEARFPKSQLLGDGLTMGAHKQALRDDVSQLLVLAAGLIFLLLWAGLRSLRWVSLCLLPLLCSVVVVAGFMGWLAMEINFMTLSILPILIGIGIDDGIHIVDRLRRGEELQLLLREAGPGVFMTSLTTAVAFLSLLGSGYQAIHHFALCGAFGLLICLLASLHLLPLLHNSGNKGVAKLENP